MQLPLLKLFIKNKPLPRGIHRAETQLHMTEVFQIQPAALKNKSGLPQRFFRPMQLPGSFFHTVAPAGPGGRKRVNLGYVGFYIQYRGAVQKIACA